MTTELQGLVLTRKIFDPVETHFTPGERSMVAWITTDCVDHERDVVVASGVDYKTFFLGKTADAGNPCVFAVHDYGRWPLGKCEWIKAKHSGSFNGLYAKTLLDEDPEAEAVWRKIKSRTLRGISIGFRPPEDMKASEWGPPTREELARRPDWKGAQRVIRRCVLLEYSVCGLPMNPQALVTAISKGTHRLGYEGTKAMDDEPEEVEDKAAAEPCKCGKAPCECEKPVETKADDEEMPAEETPETEADPDDFDEEDEESLPIKTRDHVDIKAKGFHGCGMVEKIHRKGMVEHVDEDMIGTKDDPAARVRLYKAHGDGHKPSETRIAAKLKSLSRRAEPFKEPSKTKSAEAEPEVETKAASPGPLPPLVCLSDTEIAQKALAQINDIPALVQREIARITGVV